MKRTTIIEFIAILFIILFLYTGISKLTDFSVFKEQIGTSPILMKFSSVLAVFVPLVEILTAIILFIPKTKLIGLYISVSLMILFTGYILYILNYNEELPCTCGGIIQNMSWHQHLIFNSLFVLLGCYSLLLSSTKKNRQNGQSKAVSEKLNTPNV